MPFSYKPSTSGSSDKPNNEYRPDSDDEPPPRRPIGRAAPRTAVNGSGRKKKTLIEELGGQQVLTTTESTSYGAGTAVKPIQIRRTIEGDDLAQQMANIIGGTSVPSNPLQRVPGATHQLHPGKSSTRAPSVSTATAPVRSTPIRPPPAKTPAKLPVCDSPAFDEASEAVDRASFAKDHPTPVPRKKTAAKLALSQVPEEGPTGKEPAKSAAAPRKTVPRVEIPMPPPSRPSGLPKPKSTTRPRSAISTSKASAAKKLLSWGDSVKAFFIRLWIGIKDYIKTILSLLGLLLLLLLLILGTDNAISRNPGHHYHTTINNVRHHTPNLIAHPWYWLNDQSLRDLNQRVSVLEVDVDQLKLDMERDHTAIERLSKQVPDFVVAKKNKKGELELPLDFWHAIKGKITSDKDFQLGKKGESKPVAVNWNDFWLSNEQRIKKIAADEVKISRAEIEKIIQRDVDALKTNNIQEIARTRKIMESEYAKKSDQLSQSQITKHVNEATSRQLSSSKIEALISNKIREQSSQRLRAYNHFADKMGAIVMPQNTDPTWKPNYHEGVSTGGRVLGFGLKLAGTKPPKPFGPEMALSPWEDAGDCWCANVKEHGAQLQVRTKEHFYPSEVIVEHINQEATLDKGSAPKDMELFVKVPLDKQDEVATASERMFPDAGEETVLGHEWVRVARWTYDVEANENIQVFGLQLDLKRYGVAAHDFVVRARTNWGTPSDHTCFYRVRVHGEIPAVKAELWGAGRSSKDSASAG